MSKNNINISFMVMIVASVFFTSLFFFQWNPLTKEKLDIKNKLESYYFDRCEFSSNKILVQGWAVLHGKSHVLTSVYAEKSDGSFVNIEKSSQYREDVIRAFGGDKSLDKAGFMATRYVSDKDSYTGKVIIVSHGDDGDKYAAFNNCK